MWHYKGAGLKTSKRTPPAGNEKTNNDEESLLLKRGEEGSVGSKRTISNKEYLKVKRKTFIILEDGGPELCLRRRRVVEIKKIS